MNRMELSKVEKCIMAMIVIMLVCMIIALIQLLFFQNDLHVMWLIVLALLGGIFCITGLTLVTVPARYKVRKKAVFSHYSNYLVKGGLVAFGRRLRYYHVFFLETGSGQIRTEAVDPVAASAWPDSFKKGETYEIWCRERRLKKCCVDKTRIAAIGTVYLIIAAAIVFVILGIWVF